MPADIVGITGIIDDLTAVTLADDNGNWIEMLPEAWPTDVLGSQSFDIPDALVSSSAVEGVASNTYKGNNPFDPAETLYFDETGDLPGFS